jgi:ribonuclease inhibitor
MLRLILLEFGNKGHNMSEIRHLYLDGQLIHTERDFHNLISPLLDFGPYYGNNLNALWDMLSSGVGENTVLHWANSDLARARLGETFNTIVSLFEEAKNSLLAIRPGNVLTLLLE